MTPRHSDSPRRAVEGNHRLGTTAFKPCVAKVFIGQKILQRREQKGTETTPFATGQGKVIFLEQPGEEFLGEVLGVFRRMTSAA